MITHIQNGNERIYSVIPLELISRNGNLYTFKGKSCISTLEALNNPSECTLRINYFHTDKIFAMYAGFKNILIL